MKSRSRPTGYKRYSPSPNSNFTGDQTARPKPLIDRFEWGLGLLRERFGPTPSNASEPEKFDLEDNMELLDWATREFTLKKGLYEDALDEPYPLSHDVYVVRRVHDNFPKPAPMHWSVYTQGHFYHLSVENRNGPTSLSGGQMAANGESVILKDEDYSPADGDGDDVTPKAPLPPLLAAYHVGQTDYTSSELLDLARQIISDIASYSIVRGNCQHFVTTFIMNILMRKRDNTIFIGTAKQIARWDLREKVTGVHSNTAETGFLVLVPKRTLLHISQLRLIRSKYFQEP